MAIDSAHHLDVNTFGPDVFGESTYDRGGLVWTGPTPPTGARVGDLWIDSVTTRMLVFDRG